MEHKENQNETQPITYYRAQIIRGKMAEEQITVEALERKSGVSNVTISRIRMGRPIDMKKLRQVADALEISWSDLFNFAADNQTSAA
jgi:transcriptional regulator with XRE-family HTH domain